MPAARRSPGRSALRRARMRRRRLAVTLGGTAALGVLAAAGIAALQLPAGPSGGAGPTAQARVVPPSSDTPVVETPGSRTSAPPPSSAPASSSAPPQIVTHGSGSFTVAAASGDAVGTGSTLRRYRVEVENGIDIDPEAAAGVVQAVLGDKRGWTADGSDRFQLVSSGSYDFTVKIASPDTVDRICGAGGLNTKGEVNCDVGKQVMVNSKRWLTGSPQFDGSLDDYRALIINHEVGHRIGHGHEGCPGPGKPAPAMMQQIYGLDGCVANAWPYSADGTYLRGPAAP
ncbi:DUF3152 domain-containing protein [Streptomyces sp. TLI_171]|uniref:DUF3152 domain-containing protein n=1 Tax=Streptomyces sp. TLI_171 TaxID=1938859 RepID=UPI000C1976C1|nr:DUF3152 domain-containing protein [Streptomyces sp. TLI_171]RKE20217.1 uncharacterized protein DUF3152 [Streptomyces sp. TLI_171]